MKNFNLHITLIFLIVLVSSCNLDNTTSTIEKKAAKKSVRTETKWVLDINTENRISIFNYKEYDLDGKIIKFLEYNQGKLISQTSYSYQHNESHEIKNYFNLSGTIDSTLNNLYTFDIKGNVTRKIVFDKLGDTVSISTYDYDSKGNLTKKVEFNPKNFIKSETNYVYNYNQNGLITERLVNPGLNGKFDFKDEFNYQEGFNKIEKKSYNSDGQIQIIYSYDYNNDGKIIKETVSNSLGQVLKKFSYDYTYFTFY